MFHNFRQLESRVIEAAATELLDGVSDFPFEDVFGALEELIELLTDTDLRSAVLEETMVKGFVEVLLRRSLYDVSRPAQMSQRHFHVGSQ